MEDFTLKEERVASRKRGCGKIALLSALIIMAVLSIYGWWKYFYTYSDGYRTGLLQKLSHKGNFAKTYEGELVMSSVTSSANVPLASEKFYFSVPNDSLANIMMQYEGKTVRLHYQQKHGTLPWRGESVYLIDDIKESQKQ